MPSVIVTLTTASYSISRQYLLWLVEECAGYLKQDPGYGYIHFIFTGPDAQSNSEAFHLALRGFVKKGRGVRQKKASDDPQPPEAPAI